MLDKLSAENKKIILELINDHGYEELTETQKQAFTDDLFSNKNHLLVAQTGNGKTLCAEALVKKRLKQGGKVAYLVPSKQLVRDKKETIRLWADTYNVSSGKQKYYNSDVAIATFASFYRAVLQDIGDAREFDLVILDDFHEIYGTFIGPEIEKTIAAIQSENIEIFAMSATIGNPVEIGEWLEANVTISNEKRRIDIIENTHEYSSSKKEELANLVQSNQSKSPFLIFNFARSWAESRAEQIADTGIFKESNNLSKSEVANKMESKLGSELSSSLDSLAWIISNGVAYHHSSLPKEIRNYIEDLYYEGKIKCLSSTTTIAYGFDAPVQSVIVADIKRRSEWVGVWEYQQWIGRAARPGYGYENGNAFTLTKNPDEVKKKYFEPRSLEPVTTHIDNDARFRKLVLEIIENGWNEPKLIQNFSKKTLYWNQLLNEGSFGDEEMATELLENKIKSTAEWLSRNNLIKEKHSQGNFDTTMKGENAVSFLFNTFNSATLTQIKSFYSWLENVNEINKFNLTEAICDIFDITISNPNPSTSLQQQIQSNGFSVNEASVTSAIINWYWIKNIDTQKIENQTGIDSKYIYNISSQLANTLSAIEYLFTGVSKREPKWVGIYERQVEKGVREDEVPIVDNIYNIGRYRVRQLRQYLTDESVPISEELNSNSLGNLLQDLYETTETDSQFKDVLKSQINGVGTKTSEEILKYTKNNTKPNKETTKQTTSKPNKENYISQNETKNQNKNQNENRDTKNSTLDDWTE